MNRFDEMDFMSETDFMEHLTNLTDGRTDAMLADVEGKLLATARHIKDYPGLFTWWQWLGKELEKLLALKRREAETLQDLLNDAADMLPRI
jgi:hypothetical protein